MRPRVLGRHADTNDERRTNERMNERTGGRTGGRIDERRSTIRYDTIRRGLI